MAFSPWWQVLHSWQIVWGHIVSGQVGPGGMLSPGGRMSPGGILSWGILSRGILSQVTYSLGGILSRGILSLHRHLGKLLMLPG